MGYKPTRKNFLLEFVDHPGLEVHCRSTSLGELMDIAKMRLNIQTLTDEDKLSVFGTFTDCVESWNIDHPAIKGGAEVCPRCELPEDAPVPRTIDGMMCLDLDFIMTIIFGWVSAQARVSAPKGLNFNNGEMNPEDLLSQIGQQASPLTSPMLS